MNPEDVERLLGRFEPAPPPERLERNVLDAVAKVPQSGPERFRRPDLRIWGLAGVAAACLVLSVILWRVLVPHPGDPTWGSCRSVELETHLDDRMVAEPPAFPTVTPSRDAYAPLFRRADVVKPTADELRWQTIPWITDLEEARRRAGAERRPLLVWVSSDDPLGRCCGCAAKLRVGPLSQEDVVRRIATAFVPAAVDWKSLPPGKSQDYLHSLQRQKSQYHGIWIVSPEGKVLSGHDGDKPKAVGNWNQEILETLETGLKAFGKVEPRAVATADLFPFRGAGVRPDGGVSLSTHVRLTHRGKRDGPVVFDTLTLTSQEWGLFVPPRATVGEEWVVPDALARRFCRLLAPISEPEFMPRPEQAKVAELRATVASVDGAVATIRLTGRWETEHVTSEGKPVRASATGEGVAVFDAGAKTMRSFLLVTTGTYGVGSPSEPREAGGVLEWTLEATR